MESSSPADTRQRLLDAAWAVIRASGLRAATSRAITSAAGVNLAAITYHFGSKDELVARTIVARIEGWLSPALDHLSQEAIEPTERAMRAIVSLNDSLTALGPDRDALLDALAAAKQHPLVAQSLSDLFRRLRQQLIEHLSDPTIGLPSWVEPNAFGGLLIAAGMGIAMITAIDPASPTAAAMSTQFAATLFAARSV